MWYFHHVYALWFPKANLGNILSAEETVLCPFCCFIFLLLLLTAKPASPQQAGAAAEAARQGLLQLRQDFTLFLAVYLSISLTFFIHTAALPSVLFHFTSSVCFLHSFTWSLLTPPCTWERDDFCQSQFMYFYFSLFTEHLQGRNTSLPCIRGTVVSIHDWPLGAPHKFQ